MNANELADYLDNNVEAMLMSEQPHLDQAATMLRQQQAEIDTYRSQNNNQINTYRYKELTNEEISDIRDEFFAPDGCNIYTFARALLKKAQEND
jgi:hypothetical protein